MILYKKKNSLVHEVNYLARFDRPREFLEPRYGLPSKVEFCRRCVISNQRPNSAVEFQHKPDSEKKTIHFDEDGICDACRLAERKQTEVDWQLREKALWELCDRHRKDGKKYDCLIPGSGGKDSFFAAHILKYKYGMHPLTVTWAPHMYTEWGFKNFHAWLSAGFDNYLMTPNPRVHRLMTRLAVENLFHPFQPFMFGQKALAPRIASLLNIPLVFFGENEAEYGNPLQDSGSAERDWSYFTANDQSEVYLGGISVEQLVEDFGLTQSDLQPYLPLDPGVVAAKGMEVHYLGYYLPWHPQAAYYYAVENTNFLPSSERLEGSYFPSWMEDEISVDSDSFRDVTSADLDMFMASNSSHMKNVTRICCKFKIKDGIVLEPDC